MFVVFLHKAGMDASGSIEARIAMQGLICAAMPGKRRVHSAAPRQCKQEGLCRA